jgi:adenylate cyclase
MTQPKRRRGSAASTFDEIERKFLVRGPVDAPEWEHFRQVYLSTGTPEVRVRITPTVCELTVKGPDKGGAETTRRQEVTLTINLAAAEAYERMSDAQLSKRRATLGRWCVDAYDGDLEGLYVAEVELDAEDEPLPALPEGMVLIREVTSDPRFRNTVLAVLGADERRAFVRDISGG